MATAIRAGIRAGSAYFLIVFAIAFGLGVLRVTFVIPRVGPLIAVLIEAPILLSIAWPLCRSIIRRFAVPDATLPRFAMGIWAFALLMIAELMLSIVLGGRTPAQHWALYHSLAEQIGLVAQLLFAALPIIQRGAGAAPR
jgi:hypothetical protein